MTDVNNLIARYGYDPLDRRIWKEQFRSQDGQPLTQAQRTHYLYADEGLIAEATQAITLNQDGRTSSNGAAQITSQYGPKPESQFTTGMLFIKTKNSNGQDTVAYYHHDHLATPIQATDKAGNIVWAASYQAFGKASIITPQATQDKPTITSNLRLPGQYEDAETGLHYNWHRYYDSETGRYTQGDPIGLEGGINTYAYVEGNPVSYTDPVGLMGRGMPSDGFYKGKGVACKCPTPPKGPPGACVADNIEIAKDYPAWNPGSMFGLYENVKNCGPWDYKRLGSQYEDFGNFNFGAVTAAMGVPDYIAKNAAGIYQQLKGAAAAGAGTPLLVWPYGDDPKDAAEIERGRQYARCGCR